jgi:hypothetical protein
MKIRSSIDIIVPLSQFVVGQLLSYPRILHCAILNFKQTMDYNAILIQEALLRYIMLNRRYIKNDKDKQFLKLPDDNNKLVILYPDDAIRAGDSLQVQNQQQQGVRLHE